MQKMLPMIVLAGGLATRLRPVTETIPKALIEINGEPFINHQLRLLKQHGITHIILCVGYLGEMIQDHIGNGSAFGVQVDYAFDGPTLLGTGGAIKNALHLVENDFFVVYGDSYLNCDYLAAQQAYFKCHKQGLMTVFHNEGRWDTSNVEFSSQRILAYDKKNRTERMRHIDYGLGILNKQAFNHVPANESYDLANLYQTLLNNDQLAAFEVTERFYEVGSFAGIKELEYYLSCCKTIHEFVD